jgi:hypothetical protein
MVFGNQDTEDKDIIDKATSAILDYQRANLNSPTTDHTNRTNRTNNNYGNNYGSYSRNTHQHQQRANLQANQRWKKPNRGKIKANCDTNLKVNGKLGLGAIFRDDDGQVLASATWEMPDLCDPTTAEAYALYLTTRMVVDCCFTRVEFECDSSIVVKRVNEP